MLENTIKTFRDVLKALQGEEHKIKADLEKALQRRESLHTLPLPLDDYIAAVHEQMDKARSDWPDHLKHKLVSFNDRPLVERAWINFNPLATVEGSKLHPGALMFCFGQEAKKGVAAAISSWDDYPETVGPTRAQRFIELKKLDKDIAILQGKLKKIRGAAESESTSLMGVAKGTKGDRKLLVKPK